MAGHDGLHTNSPIWLIGVVMGAETSLGVGGCYPAGDCEHHRASSRSASSHLDLNRGDLVSFTEGFQEFFAKCRPLRCYLTGTGANIHSSSFRVHNGIEFPPAAAGSPIGYVKESFSGNVMILGSAFLSIAGYIVYIRLYCSIATGAESKRR